MAMTLFAKVDDKHVPLYRVMWVSDVPHFCGAEDCLFEGRYEIRLENGESVFGTRQERDQTLQALEQWQAGFSDDEDDWLGDA